MLDFIHLTPITLTSPKDNAAVYVDYMYTHDTPRSNLDQVVRTLASHPYFAVQPYRSLEARCATILLDSVFIRRIDEVTVHHILLTQKPYASN